MKKTNILTFLKEYDFDAKKKKEKKKFLVLKIFGNN